jgi:uncharacterized protein
VAYTVSPQAIPTAVCKPSRVPFRSAVRDTRHCRIYRIYPKGSRDDPKPSLDPTKPQTLISALGHDNQFWRMEAQRMLIESKAVTVIPELEKLVRNGSGHAPLHAFAALAGLGPISAETAAALHSKHRGLRRLALKHPEADSVLVASFTREGVLSCSDDRELAELLVAISRLDATEETGRLIHATALAPNSWNTTLEDAWQIAARRHAAGVLTAAGSSVTLPESEARVLAVAEHFSKHSDPAKKAAVATTLGTNSSELAKQILLRFQQKTTEHKTIDRKNKPDPAVHARGLEVHNKTCIACHGPEGLGVAMAFPPLVGSQRLTGDPSIPVRIVLHGLQGPLESSGQKFNNIMAPLGHLTDQEIADVLSYVRQNWSNDAPALSANAVKAIRTKYTGRTTMWKPDEFSK